MKTKIKNENQFLWRIWGVENAELDPIYIRAANFDEAIRQAHNIDKGYCAGQIVSASRQIVTDNWQREEVTYDR